MIIAGLDIGTTKAKISVFDGAKYLGGFSHSYKGRRDDKAQTVDPLSILEVTKELIKEANELYGPLEALGVTSFGEAFVLLDDNDQILFDCMLYSDERGQKEAEDLQSFYGSTRLIEETGNEAKGMFSLSKLLYIKNNYPSILAKARYFDMIEDYVVYSLSGKRQLDYALACRSSLFNVTSLGWDGPLLFKVGLEPSLFPSIVPPGTKAGTTKGEIAKELGLSPTLSIVTGAHDQIAAMIGAGCLNEGDVSDGLGTCEVIAPLYRKEKANLLKLGGAGYGVIPYPIGGFLTSYAMINTGGALFDWYMKVFGSDGRDEWFKKEDSLIERCPSDIIFMPHFAGSGTPYGSLNEKGSILNLTLSSSREEIYRGLIESLVYEMRFNLEFMNGCGISSKRILSSGGGSKNGLWLQRKADILGEPIYAFSSSESGTRGSAILIGKALGLFPSLEEGIKTMASPQKVFLPHQERKKAFDAKYEEYKALRSARQTRQKMEEK